MHTLRRPQLRELVDEDALVSAVGSGFNFTEGPIWHPLEHYLLFSDMPDDVRRRWDEHHGVRESARPSNKSNGMTYDAALNLVICEHATSSLVRLHRDGRRQVLASHFEGKALNSPNDVCMRSDGSFYFTDPWYGRMPVFDVERPRELGWQGVFRVPPAGGAPQLLVERHLFDMPNGLCFSPDESLLYVNDTANALIRRFEVLADGALRGGGVFASGLKSQLEEGLPDGMKCDAKSNVWVTAPGGVAVFNPGGEHLGTIKVPELVANLHWAGPGWSVLMMTASTSLYRLQTKVSGRLEPFMLAQPAPTPQAPVTARESPPQVDLPQVDPSRVSPSRVSPSRVSNKSLLLDPDRCALIIQDMQNDVVMEGGAFADSGAPEHAKQQNVIARIARLADTCRARGVPVIHVWFLVDPGARGLTLNAPLFESVLDANALVRGTWGAQPVKTLERKNGDFVVEKMRMSAWQGTPLETLLKSTGRDVCIVTGAWTNMSIEHTARTGADKGYFMIVPENACSTINADWHNAAISYALQNVSVVTDVDAVVRALSGG
ncbi:MAG: isochorismatase family protein [Gammaproteobacteria bacterium]|nr:isochorismatase family protein [Gammaproteobacteria bacterium]